MEPKHYIHLLSCILLILLLNPSPMLTRSNSPHQHDSKIPSSPLDFLNNMIGSRKGSSTKGLSQLSKLGYLSSHNNIHENDDLFDDNLDLAIKRYQEFFKLDVNGVLDVNTVNKMKQPRCGVPDFFANDNKINFENLNNSKYTFFPGKPTWPPTKRNLTYSFPEGTRADVKQAIQDASGLWAGVSPFKFTYIPNYDKADIKISFQYRDHGDGSPFDGPRGILAHAFGPSDGRLHYDGDEKWADGVVPDAFDLQSIGLHELGHSLGLGHTTDGDAIMWPSMGDGFRKGLGQDDINGIKDLYPSGKDNYFMYGKLTDD